MYTYGNNALAIIDSNVVEELTAYSDRDLSLLVENAYNIGIRHEKARQRRAARKKRKERIESIKLTIALFIGYIVFPCLMFLYWLVVGY